MSEKFRETINLKTLYICGDSFSSHDPDYPGAWPELLQSRLPNIKIVNLSSPAASNYLIYLQVKHALAANCDYLIYNATSSIRQEFVLNKNLDIKDSLSRYWNLSAPTVNNPMICVSWINPQNTAASLLDKKTITELSNFLKNILTCR